ncbi:MAG: twitching motility protein PilT [Gemmatimonas sp. SG8_38_2]|jgi:predicted nucleic acid-binding protein|nr:MAG: twitching motility protein PilT [Gemmatimonas sp. SG8_38_2]
MNVVDSSAWLEYFADGPNAGDFAEAIQDADNLVVPSITLFEVFKRIRVQRDSEIALRAVSQMRRGTVVDLDADLAIAAADLSADLRLALADSVILATAQAHDATVWTQDSDFEGLEKVEYRVHRA